jgi:hypothetical protein
MFAIMSFIIPLLIDYATRVLMTEEKAQDAAESIRNRAAVLARDTQDVADSFAKLKYRLSQSLNESLVAAQAILVVVDEIGVHERSRPHVFCDPVLRGIHTRVIYETRNPPDHLHTIVPHFGLETNSTPSRMLPRDSPCDEHVCAGVDFRRFDMMSFLI